MFPCFFRHETCCNQGKQTAVHFKSVENHRGKQERDFKMESLLAAAVVAAVLSPTWAPRTEVKFDRLPQQCAAVYEPCLKEMRRVDCTEVIYLDMDGDGTNEMLVWDGSAGSGGQGWHIMRKHGNTWCRLEHVFGMIATVDHADRIGLLVCLPCGWDSAAFEYYELKKGVMEKMLTVEVKYGIPVRRKPVEIKLRYPGQVTGPGRNHEWKALNKQSAWFSATRGMEGPERGMFFFGPVDRVALCGGK